MGEAVQPFLKWAGGKRWLAQVGALPRLGKNGRYFEPFLGSAAMFFALRPPRALLSDANADLIELYEVIRDHPTAIQQLLEFHQRNHSHQHYYRVRADIPVERVKRAARMLYLNRTCWNGLYRVNLKGEFNVPIGTKTRVVMEDDFEALSAVLSSVELRNCDFSESIAEASVGDLIYADPPYTVRHNANGFLKYNEQIFSWNDQVRLRDAAVRAASRGATVFISNADHESLHDLYSGVGTFKRLHRASVISGATAARGQTSEILFVITPPEEAVQEPDLMESTLRHHEGHATGAPHR